MRLVVSFACGLVFAVGLAIAGMTNPAKVVGFLDVTGAWDPTLAFVMAGALGVYAVAWRFRRGLAAPVLGGAFPPRPGAIDARLLVGAAIFGIGWGISGYCPGPAVVSATVVPPAAAFVLAMLAGMALVDRIDPVLRATRLQPARES
ncbi:MAG TPA: DUF6691 family protein [Haliangiales bacterium]|nr:DUF6691 family protein [Haliangiales bacterium]